MLTQNLEPQKPKLLKFGPAHLPSHPLYRAPDKGTERFHGVGYKWGGVRVEGEIFGCGLVGNVWCLVAVWLGFGWALVQGLLADCQRNLGALHWVQILGTLRLQSFGPWRCRANPDATCTGLRGRRNMSAFVQKYEETAQFGNLWKSLEGLWKLNY